MPVRNAVATVGVAVQSIVEQAFTDWELVAVDDGSTDGTDQRLRQLGAGEPRIRVVYRPARGIVAALNEGMALARGRLIARMDADDESHPERLAQQVAALERDPGSGVVGTRVAFGGDPLAQAGYALHVAWLNALVTRREISLNRFVESPFAHPSVMFRRELVERHGGYRDGPFPEDYELWLRWLEAGVEMAKVPATLLTWNDPPGRLSRTDPRYDAEAFHTCKAPYLARWLARHVSARRQILVWGAGRPTRRRAEWLVRHGVEIHGYVDVDPQKIGRQFAGRPVVGPDAVPSPDAVFILGYVAKRGARELIRDCLGRRGYEEGRDFLLAA
ncbi:MAG: glycosyltransferase [Verrucomicrobia bacterium]|nr:glycosyltransferase [Verrucomicrobiota bacterium]